MQKIITFILVTLAFIISSCAVDFTQTDFPENWTNFPEEKSKNTYSGIDGTFYSNGFIVTKRLYPRESKYRNLGYILFSKLPGSVDPDESHSKSITFETLENGNIKVTAKRCGRFIISEYVWVKDKDFSVKEDWIILTDSLYLITAWEGQSVALRVNRDGDLVVEVRDYGFGWYIIFGAGNYNAWYRFTKKPTDNDKQEDLLDGTRGEQCCSSTDCPLGYLCIEERCEKSVEKKQIRKCSEEYYWHDGIGCVGKEKHCPEGYFYDKVKEKCSSIK